MHRIDELLKQMTLEEKVSMVSGSGPWHSTGIERLGIPPLKVTDGPNGARGDGVSGATAACFPVGSALAATWDTELIEQVGKTLGIEAKSKSSQVLLGPTINIHRVPLGGRHFECYSEDPYLTGRLAVSYTLGVQSEKVGVSLKHFVCNDTEYRRHSASSDVSERALREIYLLPFEMAVKEADAWTVMSSYNRINGTFASSHYQLLTEILKKEWGFKGFVVSDWGACLQTVENANGGLDLEMPGPARTMGENLLRAVNDGEVKESTIDDKVRRLLWVTIKSGKMDNPQEADEFYDDSPATKQLAKQTAADGMVLLKNNDVLPLKLDNLKTIAVIGPNAEVGTLQGGGSSGVRTDYEIHPLPAIQKFVGDQAEVIFEKGCLTHKYLPAANRDCLKAKSHDDFGLSGEYFRNVEFSGEPEETILEKRSKISWFGAFGGEMGSVSAARNFSVRFTGIFTPNETGTHTFGLMSAGYSKMFIDGNEIIDNWTTQTRGESFYSLGTIEEKAEIELEAGRAYELTIEFKRDETVWFAGLQYGMLPPVPSNMIKSAVSAAKKADAVVLVAGSNGDWETEGNDRHDMTLPGQQIELIDEVCKANPNTVIVLNACGPVEMPWYDSAPAVLQSWFPGQEFGSALVDLLFGNINPSGKMPTTIPKRLEDTPAFTTYPGEQDKMLYGEDLFVGYKWYEKRGIDPLIPFGHGLSYTTFDYGELEVDAEQKTGKEFTAQITITNSGEVAGKEVVQLYVRDIESTFIRPLKELKAFKKLFLNPGESQLVTFTLNNRSLACWDRQQKDWIAEPGEFELRVGSSSQDIRATAKFNLTV
jgi:beta-glucosidase